MKHPRARNVVERLPDWRDRRKVARTSDSFGRKKSNIPSARIHFLATHGPFPSTQRKLKALKRPCGYTYVGYANGFARNAIPEPFSALELCPLWI